jgi:hypothetical protein
MVAFAGSSFSALKRLQPVPPLFFRTVLAVVEKDGIY